MRQKLILLLAIQILIFFNCEIKEDNLDQDNPVVTSLDRLQYPLSSHPLEWKDDELSFIDVFTDARVIGLGEASHGSKEFFEAKHRLFRYLVENAGFNVFAFEADVGESLYLNDAILEGRTTDIKELMLTKMHFWTWKTREVQALLEWMCDYNLGKGDADKIHYIGIDCQFNTYHPGLVKKFLEKSNAPFYGFACEILDEAEEASKNRYEDFNKDKYGTLLGKINTLADSLVINKNQLIANSSLEEYILQEHILNVLQQSLTVGYHSSIEDFTKNYRDEYMAENVEWILEGKKDSKIAVWAHNGHIGNIPEDGWMGSYLTGLLNDDYKIIAFSFSRGSFTAVGMDGEKFSGLKTHTVSSAPKLGSLNELFSRSGKPVFAILIKDMLSESLWINLFDSGLEMFSLGAVYSENLEINYYSPVQTTYYDAFIYFDSTNASELLIY
jgi:erythromycin esterase